MRGGQVKPCPYECEIGNSFSDRVFSACFWKKRPNMPFRAGIPVSVGTGLDLSTHALLIFAFLRSKENAMILRPAQRTGQALPYSGGTRAGESIFGLFLGKQAENTESSLAGCFLKSCVFCLRLESNTKRLASKSGVFCSSPCHRATRGRGAAGLLRCPGER